MKRTEWKKLKAKCILQADETIQQLLERQNNTTSGPRFIYQFVGANNSNLRSSTERFKPRAKHTRLVILFCKCTRNTMYNVYRGKNTYNLIL